MARESEKIIEEFFKGDSCHLTHEFGLYNMSNDVFTVDEINENDSIQRYNREAIMKNVKFWREFFEGLHAAGKMDYDLYWKTISDLNKRSKDFARKLSNFKSSYRGN